MKYSLAYLSYNNNDQNLRSRSMEILNDFFSDNNFFFEENDGHVLFVASGGSERQAVDLTLNCNNVTILCHRENNSYAAAIEIAAFLRAKNKRVSLIDVFAEEYFKEFVEVQKVNQALDELAKQKAALIGEVSEWLIISDVESETIKEKLGVELLRIPWSSLGDYKAQNPSQPFMDQFPDVDQASITETAKVYTLLENVVKEKKLSAISVECFSMVVKDKVTACLPLAVLNQNKLVAACEGDICSMLGMMLIQSVAGDVPWQANVAEIKDELVLLAHCTAPLNTLKSFEVTTHFETNCGTAIQGVFEKERVGVFRIESALQKYMLLEGDIVSTPNYNYACRTQIEFKTTLQQAQLLKTKSLGNHHLVFPAKFIPVLERMMNILDVEKVQ